MDIARRQQKKASPDMLPLKATMNQAKRHPRALGYNPVDFPLPSAKPQVSKNSSNLSSSSSSDLQSPTHSRTSGEEAKKLKTELCKNWESTGFCNYGVRCCFAHGDQELKPKHELYNPSKYRSKKCQSFHNKFYCPYGKRCTFKHAEENLLNFSPSFYRRLIYLSLENQRTVMERMPLTQKKSTTTRLEVFQEICSDFSNKEKLSDWDIDRFDDSETSESSTGGDQMLNYSNFFLNLMEDDSYLS